MLRNNDVALVLVDRQDAGLHEDREAAVADHDDGCESASEVQAPLVEAGAVPPEALEHAGDDVVSADEAKLVSDIPALRQPVAALTGGDESPAAVASAVEFILEGLHLSKRLNKDAVGARATYRARG